MNRTSRNYFLLAIIIFIISFFYCKDGKPQPISDSTNKIKLGGAMWANTKISFDTTKPVINHRYILRGSDTMFILLQNLILSPGDVTPNNKNAVVDWFRNNIKIDSTKNK